MYIEFYILLFILSIITFIGSLILRDEGARLICAVLSAIMFAALALASFYVEIVHVLEVNNTLVEHTTVIYSPSLAYVYIAFLIVCVLNGAVIILGWLRRGAENV